MDFFKQLTDNFILEINDLEIVYVYHVIIVKKTFYRSITLKLLNLDST